MFFFSFFHIFGVLGIVWKYYDRNANEIILKCLICRTLKYQNMVKSKINAECTKLKCRINEGNSICDVKVFNHY